MAATTAPPATLKAGARSDVAQYFSLNFGVHPDGSLLANEGCALLV